MLMDVDALTHYNAWTTKWRKAPGDITSEIPFDMMTNESLKTTPPNDQTASVLNTQDNLSPPFDDSITTSTSSALIIPSANLPLSSSVMCGFSVVPITTVGPSAAPRSKLAKIPDTTRSIWLVDPAVNPAITAIEKMGSEFIIKMQIESDEYWHPHHQSISYKATFDKLMDPKYEAIIDWFLAVCSAPHEIASWIHDMA
jgi:hypothetical protein